MVCVQDWLVHGQVVMALSSVALVACASLLLNGSLPGGVWLLAAGFGTLAVYVLDGLRSAAREDAISQPRRSAFNAQHRATLWIVAIFAGAAAFAALLSLRLPGEVWCAFIVLASLVVVTSVFAKLLTPMIGAIGRPLLITGAWVLGALLVAVTSDGIGGQSPYTPNAVLLFVVVAAPLLLLDTTWLDRRDARADEIFGLTTLGGQLTNRKFYVLSVVLLALPIVVVALVWPSGSNFRFAVFASVAASPMAFMFPERLRSESARVVLASFWRFAALAGVL